jgi:hypothetical protein
VTEGLYQSELTLKALAALRQQPNCANISSLDLYGLPDVAPGERNWEIANVDNSRTYIGDIERGIISVHYQLGRKFHLITDN